MYRGALLVLQIFLVINKCWSTALDQPPSSMAAYLYDYAEFHCTIQKGMPRIFWFINETPAATLPRQYDISFSNQPLSNSMGASSRLQMLALEETNNSEIMCAVDTSGFINSSYFPLPALLFVQGFPLPPTHFTENLGHLESAYIEFSWQPPLALLISEGITYALNISAFYDNFTQHYNIVTSNLSHAVDLEAQYLCSLSHIIVTVYSENKVGIGTGIQEKIQLNSMCTTTYTQIITEGNSTTNCSEVADDCNNQNSDENLSPASRLHSVIYIAAAIGLSVLILGVFAVVILLYEVSRGFFKNKESKDIVLPDPDSRQPNTEPNEAYACILKVNNAYGRVTGLSNRPQQRPENDFEILPNEAYESMRNQPRIYEQIL